MSLAYKSCLPSLLLSAVCWCQAPTGEITGAITDPTGAAVAGATVTLTHPATNMQRSVMSNEAGIFALPALPPGSYDLRVEKPGFTTPVRTGIELQVGQVARLDFGLKVGNVSEVIEVTGGAPLLDTETSGLGTVVENRRIVDLPLNGRNYLQLASLIPGATTNARPSVVAQIRMGGARSDFTLSVSGQRIAFNHYTLDGIENTDVNFAAYYLLPSIDALQEFKVESGLFGAEFGRGTSQVNVTTKSGANQYHGTLFEFLRNSELDAKNLFDKPNLPIPAFKRNQFGFTLGGPITIPRLINGKDKLFFMANYEGLRERKALTQTATVPLAAQRTGDFSGSSRLIYDPASRVFNAAGQVTAVSAFPGNVIPSNRIHRVASKVLEGYVPPPNSGLTPQAGFFVNNEGRNTNGDQFTARGDWVQSSASNWFFRYSLSRDDGLVPAILPQQGNSVVVDVDQGMLGNTRVFGPNKVNEFRFGVTHMSAFFRQTRAFKENVVKDLGIPDIPGADVPLWYGLPVFLITGFSSIGDCGDCPWAGFNTVIQVNDTFSWTRGKHTLHFGGDYRRTRFNNTVPGRPRGRFSFDGRFTENALIPNRNTTGSAFADFLLSGINQSETVVGAPIANFRNYYLGLYLQDAWRVTPRLTLNWGLRYEDEPPWLDKYDAIVNLDFRWNHSMTPVFVRAGKGALFEGNPAFQTPTTIPEVRDGRFGRRVARHDKNDFAPRLGIAYILTPKTIIRTSAGIFYVREISNGDFETVRNPPFSVQRGELSEQERPNLSFDRPFALPVSVPTFVLAVQYGEPSAYVGQYSFGLQRQLTSNMSLETTYVGSSGVHLRRMTIYNQAPPGEGSVQPRRPFPQLGGVQLTNAASHSTYHALQVRVQQRFQKGFTLLSSFAWGKSIDNGSAVRSASNVESLTPPDEYDLRRERGLSNFDFRRRWTNSWLYELPFGKGKPRLGSSGPVVDAIVGGWHLGGILTLQDGFPLTAFCGPGNIQNGGGGCYPDSLGVSPNLARGQQTADRFFNTDAFVDRLPGGRTFRFGNAARNTIIGPGIISWDLSAGKNFRFTERQRLDFRAEFFNFPNHSILGAPGASLRTANYGKITSTAIDSRQIQFGLKWSF
jgi:hypothetical protein